MTKLILAQQFLRLLLQECGAEFTDVDQRSLHRVFINISRKVEAASEQKTAED